MSIHNAEPATDPRQVTPADFVAELYRAHAVALIRIALLLVGDQHSAEDVIQDGTHVVADVKRDGGCGSWFYQFRLNGAGEPSALTPYKLPFIRQIVTTIALSQDNRTFAYLGEPCPNSPHAPSWLTVLSLRTMATSRWEMPLALADASMPLELTANGGLRPVA